MFHTYRTYDKHSPGTSKITSFFLYVFVYSVYLVISSEILYNSNREENIIKAWEFRIDSALLKKDSVRLVGMIGHYDFCVGLRCQKNLLYLLFQAKMTNSNQHFRNILRLLAFYWTFCMSLNIWHTLPPSPSLKNPSDNKMKGQKENHIRHKYAWKRRARM